MAVGMEDCCQGITKQREAENAGGHVLHESISDVWQKTEKRTGQQEQAACMVAIVTKSYQ